MRDTVLYVRGPFPFGSDRIVSADLVEDAKLALAIHSDQLTAIAQDLDTYPGFLDRKTIRGVVGHYISDKNQRNRLAKFIDIMGRRLRASGYTVSDLLFDIRKWFEGEENQERNLLSVEDLEALQRLLPLIIKPYPGLVRQQKAEQLSEATGQRLEDFQIICDLRPVFDETRSAVESIVPFTTVKMVCKGVDGIPVSLEAILSEAEVNELVKKTAAAAEKLKQLRALLAAKDLPIPPVELTKSGE